MSLVLGMILACKKSTRDTGLCILRSVVQAKPFSGARCCAGDTDCIFEALSLCTLPNRRFGRGASWLYGCRLCVSYYDSSKQPLYF